MKLIDQVITLEQAKRLKSLGVRQDSIWFWAYPVKEKMISTKKDIIHNSTCEDILSDNEGDEFDHDVAAAFTLSELGAMLPKVVKLADIQFRYGIMHDCHVQYIIQDSESDRILVHKGQQVWTTGKTEAEARAAMLIHLLENKLITVEEVNARLCA